MGSQKVHKKSVMLTIVDHFSMYAHFLPLGHPYMATSAAWAFFSNIGNLHGFPSSIISNRDSLFTRNLWNELLSLVNVKLNMTSAFHPPSNGQSEATNKVITRYFTRDQPRQWQWLQWLPWAEYSYNSLLQCHCKLRRSMSSIAVTGDLPSVRTDVAY